MVDPKQSVTSSVYFMQGSAGERHLLIACRPFRCLGVILICLPMTVFAVDLNEYVWRNRLLLLFATEASDPLVRQVRDNLERHADELVERDLLVLQLFVHGQSRLNDQPISAAQVRKLRARLGIDANEQLLVLVGKDGSVKRRAPLSTDVREIFRQIDAMPMRRDEMRERG